MKKAVDRYKPLKKVVAGLLASGVIYLGHRYLSLDLGSEQTYGAIQAAIGPAVAWAVKDPRVTPVLDAAEAVVETTQAAA